MRWLQPPTFSLQLLVAVMLMAFTPPAAAQTHVAVASGEVTRSVRPDPSRLTSRIPGMDDQQRVVIRVGGDSAQRIAMADYEWRGTVTSVEIDEEDARTFWDVKIIPDSTRGTIVRYRIDALSGGILDIREFTGIRGVSSRKP